MDLDLSAGQDAALSVAARGIDRDSPFINKNQFSKACIKAELCSPFPFAGLTDYAKTIEFGELLIILTFLIVVIVMFCTVFALCKTMLKRCKTYYASRRLPPPVAE